MVEVIESARTEKVMFSQERDLKVDSRFGVSSWSWPKLPRAQQKLVPMIRFDPGADTFKAGAHMPLMIFLGSPADTRRTKGAVSIREQKG